MGSETERKPTIGSNRLDEESWQTEQCLDEVKNKDTVSNMPFIRNVAKELLISVLSRNKSSKQSVISFLEGFY